ncbi:MAG: 4-oxalocrotonate tautomerase [Hydrogenophaga sp.]|uniref:tautomerase family protein n=1 Tax=Hydrogenophaga sp. TaxID=1904254 RepID=UPI0016AB6D7B|nr:4-oxalocrotonate tautomerase family protein [Hydrogenophaga sp.]NIM41035.1 4-oxalocrotonate tautomerase [Hydrogenophaga sp.]NIN26393.1 4-oxalocrotonate tautomerase [Hydrogenophaga sp.]NIN31268.1 4-oxalocrotonate tautomerase [Hydrogenophaga sp.]NIN55307.1 4-oxalocrotonate tautomerase [Hydrogenophaga sp.]NIO53691.1 4-oxalocrotonate tautomerase [Hydrogenophaga sp.]
MPILNVKIGTPRTPELSARITEMLLELTTRVLGKRRDLTAVVIDYVDPRDWFVAGQSLADLKLSSFYFDVKVVDETNTKAEKARYIAEAFEGFSALLGPLHHESYVHVEDVRAAAYGFGGKTQEFRHQHPGA